MQNFHCCERKNICTFIFYIREVNICICTENVWEDVEQTELLSLGIGIGKEESCIKVSFLVHSLVQQIPIELLLCGSHGNTNEASALC